MLIVPTWLLAVIVSGGHNTIAVLVSSGPGRSGARYWLAVWLNELLLPMGIGFFDGALRFHFEIFIPYHLVAWLLCCVMMPLMLLLLSRSRLTCHIRPRHVLRASVYGLGILVLWPVYLIWNQVADTIPWPPLLEAKLGLPWSPSAWEKAMLVSGLMGIAWFAAWWYVVIVRVFRLRHARAVWALLMIACTLVFAIVAVASRGLEYLLMG